MQNLFKPLKWKTKLQPVTSASQVGEDVETLLGVLNEQCFGALLPGCEVPTVCSRTFLDPNLESQYMLTHQALFLFFGIQVSSFVVLTAQFLVLII